MTTRSPSDPHSVPLAGLALGAVVFDVATAAAEGAAAGDAPEWIKIAPRGAVVARDRRRFTFEPERLVARFEADGVDLPVDLDHATVKKALWGDAAPAIGWVKALAARADGLYARVDWLDAGRATLAARTHRYVSPSPATDEDGVATWIHSVALVAAPALASLPAVAAAATIEEGPMSLTKIAKALGLAEDADETRCLAAIGDLAARPDPKAVVPKDVHDQTVATLAAMRDQVGALSAGIRKDKVDRLIDGALAAKKIAPAQKDHYVALCATDAGLATVAELIAATPAMLSASGLDDREAPSSGAIDPQALAAEAIAYQTDMAAKGVVIDTASAVLAVQNRQTAKGGK